MDSISQFTLGAAMGELVLGKKIGNKAIIWGGIAGTIPDLDVLFLPFFDELAWFTVHRGISHSILFAILLAPLLAFLMMRLYKKETATFKEWTLLFFLGLFTHPLLDCCTTYGTQLLLPFSDYRVGFNNIFVVDPVYTIPFFLSILVCLFLKRNGRARRMVFYTGLGLSCGYLLLTFVNKHQVNQVFKEALVKQNVDYQRYMTAPTPLNNVLWYCVAETEKGYHIGYYSFFDRDKDIDFRYFDRNEELIAHFENERIIDRLKWFSKDYYIVHKQSDELWFYDIKFGMTNLEKTHDAKGAFVFGFQLFTKEDGSLTFKEKMPGPEEDMNEALAKLWTRVKGVE